MGVKLGKWNACWTLKPKEMDLVGAKNRDNRLGFALLLLHYRIHAQFLDEINELSRYEKTAIFNALKDNLYPSAQDIGQVVEELRETKFSSGLACPHCNDNLVVKNGKFNGHQRYLCRSCKHTFNDFTNTPMQRTQMPEKWLQYLELMFKGFSLRAAAVEIGGVTHVTLFFKPRQATLTPYFF